MPSRLHKSLAGRAGVVVVVVWFLFKVARSKKLSSSICFFTTAIILPLASLFIMSFPHVARLVNASNSMLSTSIANLQSSAIDSLGSTLANALSQSQQNGGGFYGLLPSPALPQWVGGPPRGPGVSSGGAPWGGMTTSNSNPYTSYPHSGGQTRFYDFHIARCTIAPDGVQLQDELCVNGQFPGKCWLGW